MNEIIPLWAEGAPGFEAGYGQPQPFLQAYPLPACATPCSSCREEGIITWRHTRANPSRRPCGARGCPRSCCTTAMRRMSGPCRSGTRSARCGWFGSFWTRRQKAHIAWRQWVFRPADTWRACWAPNPAQALPMRTTPWSAGAPVRTRWRCAIRSSACRRLFPKPLCKTLQAIKTLRLRCGARCPWKNASRPIRRPPFYGIRRTMRTSRWKTA